ncbi:MAG TPA: DUF4382 domain-containing protein [Gemmatimonadaceae bacterium]|nr:DUF4382 domain-containing protein [Gemmatimonadaceae bacterium]
MNKRLLWTAVAGAFVFVGACNNRSVTGPASGQGMLAMKLTDAPVPFDSVKEVNVFVVRIDARRAHADAGNADVDVENEHAENHEKPDSTLWVTIAAPNTTFNLLALQGGVSAFLGATAVDTGHFRAIRLIIDPARSTVVLKDGTVLTTTSTSPVEFEQRGRHGLLVELNETVEVHEKETTTIVLDFRLDRSLTLRGRGVHDGFFFRPVIVGAHER